MRVFVWRFHDERGGDAGVSTPFPDLVGAEEWLGGSWSELTERGVAEVALVEREDGREREVYRRSLGEA